MTIRSTFSPRSTRLTLTRLLTKRPAQTRSIIERTICAVTSAVRKHDAERAPDGCPELTLEHVHQVGARRVQRREDPEEKAGAEREDRGERAIRGRADSDTMPDGLRREERDAISSSVQHATKSPATPAERGSRHGLGEELPHQAAAARADESRSAISADRAGAPRQEQVRDVGAGDEQHEPGHRQSRISGVRASLCTSLCPRASRATVTLRARNRFSVWLAHALLQRGLHVVDDRRSRAR